MRAPPASRAPRSRAAAVALLVAIGGSSAWLGVVRARCGIDVANRALKSTSSREAADLAALRRDFGNDASLLLGFAAAPGLELAPAENAAVAAIADRLRGLRDDVAAVAPLADADPALACLLVDLRADDARSDATARTHRVVDAARAACPPTLRLRTTSQQLAEQAVAETLAGERARIVPLVATVLFGLLWLVYRRLRIALVVLVPAGAGIACTGGLFVLAGHRLDPITTLLDPVLLTVGVAAGVHLLEAYLRAHARLTPPAAAAAVRQALRAPMLWTTVTTMVGFLALSLTELPAVARFGVYAAFGVALVSALSFWAVPEWLAALAPLAVAAPIRRSTWIAYAGWLGRRRGAILASAAVVFGLAVAGLGRVSVDNDPLRLLDADSSFRRDHDELVRQLGGVESAAIRIPADSGARDPEWIALLGAILTARPEVVGFARPPRVSARGDLLLDALLAADGSAARERLFDAIDARAADLGFPEVRAVGAAVQIARDSGRLVRGQLLGLLLVLPLLGVSVGVGLRSWRLGLLSLLPNAVPSAAIYGVMGWLDRPLSVATVMIGTAMMGLIVDDTIHLLHHYAAALRRGRTARRALLAAFDRAGGAVTATSAILVLGLGAGVLGRLETTVEFSALAAATVVAAWTLDVIIMPALLLSLPLRSPPRRAAARPPLSAPIALRPPSTCPTPSTS